MTWLDHLLAAVLVVGLPLLGAFTYRALLAALAQGQPRARLREYWQTIALEWSLVAAVLVVWRAAGRSAADLGLAVPDGRATLVGAALTLAALIGLTWQWFVIKRLDETGRDRLREQLAGAAGMLPADEPERRTFRLGALTAGSCEEILFRGFLVWYAATWIGPWPAAVVTSIAFGLGHLYQGRAGVIKTGLAGLVAGTLYVATGSLLWPIILHVAIDLQGGAVGWLVGRPAQVGLSAPPPPDR